MRHIGKLKMIFVYHSSDPDNCKHFFFFFNTVFGFKVDDWHTCLHTIIDELFPISRKYFQDKTKF